MPLWFSPVIKWQSQSQYHKCPDRIDEYWSNNSGFFAVGIWLGRLEMMMMQGDILHEWKWITVYAEGRSTIVQTVVALKYGMLIRYLWTKSILILYSFTKNSGIIFRGHENNNIFCDIEKYRSIIDAVYLYSRIVFQFLGLKRQQAMRERTKIPKHD